MPLGAPGYQFKQFITRLDEGTQEGLLSKLKSQQLENQSNHWPGGEKILYSVDFTLSYSLSSSLHVDLEDKKTKNKMTHTPIYNN